MNISGRLPHLPLEESWFHRQKKAANDMYRNGKALERHCISAHGGQVSPTCRACRDLEVKNVAGDGS